MSNIITLASGQISASAERAEITVDLVGRVVRVRWPGATTTTPASFDALLAEVTRTLARASLELAALRASGQL